MAVAHRLAERHEVGLDPEALERPHRLAGAAVAALDLVGDPQGAGLVRAPHERRDVAGSRSRKPSLVQDAVEDRGGRRVPAAGSRASALVERRRVVVRAAIGVRRLPRSRLVAGRRPRASASGDSARDRVA